MTRLMNTLAAFALVPFTLLVGSQSLLAEEATAPAADEAPKMRIGLTDLLISDLACGEMTLDPTPPFWVTGADQSDASNVRRNEDFTSYRIWDNLRWPELDGEKIVDFPRRAVVLRGDYAIPRLDMYEVVERNDRDYVPVTIVGTRDGRILEDFEKTHTRFGAGHRESEIGRYLVGTESIVAQRALPGTVGYLSAAALEAPDAAQSKESTYAKLVAKGANNVHLVKENTVILGHFFPKGAIMTLGTETVDEQTMYQVRKCCSREHPDRCHLEHVFQVRSFGQNERVSYPKFVDINSVCGFHFMRRLQPVEMHAIGAMEALRDSISRRLASEYAPSDSEKFQELLTSAQGNFGQMDSVRLLKREKVTGQRRVRFFEATETMVKFPGLVPATEDRGKGVGKDSAGHPLFEMFDFHEPNGCKLVHYKSAVEATDTFMLPEVACAVHESICVMLNNDPECGAKIVQMGECFAPRGRLPDSPGKGRKSLHSTHFTGFGIDVRPIRKDDLIAGFGKGSHKSRAYDRKCTARMVEAFMDHGANRVRFSDWKILNNIAKDILVKKGHKTQAQVDRMQGAALRALLKRKEDIALSYDNAYHSTHLHIDFNPEWILKRAPNCASRPLEPVSGP